MHHLKVFNTKFCSHHPYLVLGHFHHLPQIPYPLAVTPILPTSQCLATNLLSFFIDLSVLDISYKKNHNLGPFVPDFFHLASCFQGSSVL